jgi:predicted solute-binding protein
LARVLIDDTFATAALATPISARWIDVPAELEVVVQPGLMATGVGVDDLALISSAEVLRLQHSHEVVSGVAVVADAVGAVAMRTPVRPDEVESTTMRLVDAGGTAELLARATLTPFYGIEATGWLRGDEHAAAQAEVIIVEGAEALREQEAGFSEDLVRAWFILTEQSFVSHVLIAPRNLLVEEFQWYVAFLDTVRASGLERRREWRAPLADREGVGRDRAYTYWAAQRLTLEEGDRRALLDMLGRGGRGSPYPAPTHIHFREGTSRD